MIPPFWLPLSLLLPWLVVAWRRAIRAQDRRILLLLGYLMLVVLFSPARQAKRGVYITPGTPALALLTTPSSAPCWSGSGQGGYWPGSAGCWEG